MERWHIIQYFNSVGSIQLLSGVFTFHRDQGMDTSRTNRACILDDGRPGLRSCLIPKWLLPYPSGLISALGLLITCIACASSVMTDLLLKLHSLILTHHSSFSTSTFDLTRFSKSISPRPAFSGEFSFPDSSSYFHPLQRTCLSIIDPEMTDIPQTYLRTPRRALIRIGRVVYSFSTPQDRASTIFGIPICSRHSSLNSQGIHFVAFCLAATRFPRYV
jgi:hypothetical protein